MPLEFTIRGFKDENNHREIPLFKRHIKKKDREEVIDEVFALGATSVLVIQHIVN